MSRCRVCNGPGDHEHHLIPRSVAPRLKDERLNRIRLCAICHRLAHDRVITLFADLLTPEEHSFLADHTSDRWLRDHYPMRPYDIPPF